ncbi:MAG: HAMP domain-containing sensor histidine kinase [Bacteroidota bacterium]
METIVALEKENAVLKLEINRLEAVVTAQQKSTLHKEEFISVASHELKTPITSLKANLQLMNHLLINKTPGTEQLMKMTQNAERNVIKLQQLVDDLLSSTQLDQGHLSLDKTNLVLADLVEECCSHIRLEGRYHINYRGNPLFTIFGDRHKLDQVLVNLINNAIKYAPESFEIMIDAQHSGGITTVSVSDLGKGIASEDLAHLFERYFRLSKDYNKASGLGLGLYISFEIIRLHGGEMGVESVIGKGATFWFTIPDEHEAVAEAIA